MRLAYCALACLCPDHTVPYCSVYIYIYMYTVKLTVTAAYLYNATVDPDIGLRTNDSGHRLIPV